jgi:hypothetical protein
MTAENSRLGKNEEEEIYLFDKKDTWKIIEKLAAKINRCSVCNKKLTKMKHIGAFLENTKTGEIGAICDNPHCSLELQRIQEDSAPGESGSEKEKEGE